MTLLRRVFSNKIIKNTIYWILKIRHLLDTKQKATTLSGFLLNENLFYHGTEAENMDMNLFTEEGNTAYALYLFNKNGFKDWENSRSCWGKYVKIEE